MHAGRLSSTPANGIEVLALAQAHQRPEAASQPPGQSGNQRRGAVRETGGKRVWPSTPSLRNGRGTRRNRRAGPESIDHLAILYKESASESAKHRCLYTVLAQCAACRPC